MRKKILLSVFLVLAVVAAADMVVRERADILRTSVPLLRDGAFLPVPAPAGIGEKIIYDVMLGKLRMGSAVFEYAARTELNQRAVDLFTFSTRAARFTDFERIFSDPATFLPLRVERDISAWAKKEKIVEQYDQQAFLLSVEKHTGGKQTTQSFKKESVIHNAVLLPSVVRRTHQIDPGWSFKANLPTQEFTITFAGIEEITLPAGKFRASRFTSFPERFEIWISADQYQIPLKIKGTSGIGYTLVMRTYIKPPGAS